MRPHETSLSEEITSTPEGMRVWQQERVIFEVTERICELMEEQGVNRAQLADLLGKTRSYVTQILGGRTNLTLRSISDIYLALGHEFHPSDQPLAGADSGSLVCTLNFDDYRANWTPSEPEFEFVSVSEGVG